MTEKFNLSTYDQLTPAQISKCIAFLEQVLQLSRLPNLDTVAVIELQGDLAYLRNLMLQKLEEMAQGVKDQQFAKYNSPENWKN